MNIERYAKAKLLFHSICYSCLYSLDNSPHPRDSSDFLTCDPRWLRDVLTPHQPLVYL